MKYAAGKPISEQANYTDIISQRFATPPLSRIPRTMPCAIDMMTIPDGATGRRRWRVISAVEQAGLSGLNEGQVVEYVLATVGLKAGMDVIDL